MRSRWIIILATILNASMMPLNSTAQPIPDSVKSAIMTEGRRLYRSELATWYGTDIFRTKYKSLARKSVNGFSYADGPQTVTIFYSGEAEPTVLFSIRFNEHFSRQHAAIEVIPRAFSSLEKGYFILQKKTIELLHTDKTYKDYKDVSRHIVPLINGNEKKVYVIAAPKFEGSVIFGNDYLIEFNEQNNIIVSKPIHDTVIPVEYGINNVYNSSEVTTTTHLHNEKAGDYITATDICNLLMYQKFTNWKQHVVVGGKTVSIWNCEKNDFLTMNRPEWQKFQDEAKRK